MRSVDVRDGICFVGLDVHARTTTAAAVQLGSGEVWKAQLAGTPQAAIEWLQTLPGELRAVYEAGPAGCGLRRAGGAGGAAGVRSGVRRSGGGDRGDGLFAGRYPARAWRPDQDRHARRSQARALARG